MGGGDAVPIIIVSDDVPPSINVPAVVSATVPVVATIPVVSPDPVSSRSRKKIYKRKSGIWDHFTKVKGEEKGTENATCNYCSNVFGCSSANGTSTLWRHVQKCPKYPYNGTDPKQRIISFSSVKDESVIANWKFDQVVSRRELARMIVIDELPFSHVEKEGFKRFVSSLQPKFRMVSRTTITKDCIEIYMDERVNLKSSIERSTSQVCLTTDIWTSIQNLGYMCLTAHYIDSEWKLQKRIFNFRVFPSPHTGVLISQEIETCLLGWGIENVLTLTVDNASNNDVAASTLRTKLNKRRKLVLDGEFLHVRCFAHVINLIVRDGMKDVDESIIRIRESVKYVKGSPSRFQLFRKCVEEERITSKKLVCLDVATRWNSTYLMLDAALDHQKAFERLEIQDRGWVFEAKHGVPNEEDWEVARALVLYLEHFYLVTKRISGTKYLTANIFFCEMMGILSSLGRLSESDNLNFRAMGKKMMEKYVKYYDPEKINKLLIVAVVLNPCHKFAYVKYLLSKFYCANTVQALLGCVHKVFERLYEHYLSLELMDGNSSVGGCQDALMEDANSIGNQDWELFLEREQSVVVKSEIDRYFEEGVEKVSPNFDILAWWKNKASTYRVLSHMARDVLAIPVSTVASESAFSTGGRILDPFRSSLTPKIVECLVCTQDWFRNAPAPIEVEEHLEELEELESGITDDIAALSLGS